MMVLCILLAMLSLFLSLKLIYQRKLVQKVKKQIDFLIDRDTQTEIMVEKTDGTIQDLAASINHLLKKYRSMGQEIERSDTLFRDTITSLSHDLRTPLATANGYIQLLQEQDLTGEQKEYATIAGERISAVKLLLDQLFEFVRIEADELKLNCRNTDTLCHTGMLPSSELTNTQHQSIQTEKIKRHPMRPAVFQRIGVLYLYL